jgi:CRP-like cAMP-binding protein
VTAERANEPQNRLLQQLPKAQLARALSHMERVPVQKNQILYEAGEPISHIYFPLSGLVSLVVFAGDKVGVEIGVVGNEGIAGVPALLGVDRSPMRAFVQIPGHVLRISAAEWKRHAAQLEAVRELACRYMLLLFNQIAQSTACNRLHPTEERLCRWLLMAHDRVDSDELALTQEFIAQMLGVRRPSVTVVAGMLQKAGLIVYRRGRIRIVDRAGLEKAACECYSSVKKELDAALPQAGD